MADELAAGHSAEFYAHRRGLDVPAEGTRMLVRCEGGPSTTRLVRFPPPLELVERGGVYILDDDGPIELWRYVFVSD